jgi:ribosomal protein S12 methylthiotransferase accessory factor
MSDQLEEALQAYKDSLPAGRIETLRIDGADYLGLPIYNVDLFTDQGYYSGIGYGATETEALVGAYGELAEDCHLQLSFPNLPQREASYSNLVEECGEEAVLDPLTLVLPANSPYDPDLHLRWVQIERLRDGQPTWCPVEFVASGDNELGSYPNQLTTAISNGTGAGETEQRALLHALLELLQRDGNADSFRALDRGTVIDPATVDDQVRVVMDGLADKGLRVILKLARVTCGCASVYAVGEDTTDDQFGLSATACGEAADPDINKALRKAVLECASSHSRKRFNNLPFERLVHQVPEDYFKRIREAIVLDEEEERALRAMIGFVTSTKSEVRERLADSVFSQKEKISAAGLPAFTEAGIEQRLQYVLDHLKREGMEPYVFRASSPDGKCHAVKVVVPGIEMEFGSYHRIGYRGVQRLLADDPFALLSRVSAPGNALIRLTEQQDHDLGGPFYLNTARLDEIIDPLYGLYREPTAHAAPIAIQEGYFADTPNA